LPWWLDQVRRHDALAGRRTLDVLDVHWYPQSAGVYGGGSEARTDPATCALRLRSTRSLWDATYVDESWIGEPVRLIPRLREWIDRHYPGTRLGIGEWNWGADTTLNGALAIADVLGILGREAVDLAAFWTVPPPGSPGAAAFRLYTNYDGEGSSFGDRSLPATSTVSEDVAVYASRERGGDALVITLLNKRPSGSLPARVRLEGRPGRTAAAVRLYRYSREVPGAIVDLGEQSEPAGLEIAVELPASSATVLRIRP
jgi:hypothetical protein